MKRVLLAVCGLTPQVITETLYALHQDGRMPDAVRVITTSEGKAACNTHLFSPEDGMLRKFLDDYGIDSATLDFSPRHVKTVCDENGLEIEDITGEIENELFLKSCMELAFSLTSDPECQVMFSIAGGRKTMGACLAVAAQCYGRPQDRIFHVLVTPEFESSREFFYPPPVSREIILKDSKGQPFRKETRFARVSLVSLPFIPIRDRLTEQMLKEPEAPATLMLSLVREKRHKLVIDLKERHVSWKGVQCDMMPAHLALFTFFAFLKKESPCGKESCHGCDNCFLSSTNVLEHQERITSLYRNICSSRCIEEMSDSGVVNLTTENFNSYRSKIASVLEKSFGAHEMKHIGIESRGKRPGVRYGLVLDRDRISIIL